MTADEARRQVIRGQYNLDNAALEYTYFDIDKTAYNDLKSNIIVSYPLTAGHVQTLRDNGFVVSQYSANEYLISW